MYNIFVDPINPIAGNPGALNQNPEPPKDNHWITIVSMAMFVLLSLTAVAFLYYQNQQLKSMLASYQTPVVSPTPTATTDPTANWKTYSNSTYVFSLKYPSNLTQGSNGSVSGPFTGTKKVIEGFADQSTVREGTDAAFDGFTLWATTDTRTASFDKYLDNELVAMSGSPFVTNKNLTKTRLNISGITGYFIESSQTITYYYILSPDSKTVIVFSRIYANPSFLPAFDQILSTFKFIGPAASPSASPVACTQEVKICPNGSYVGRTGPNCEFAPCPSPY